MKNKWILYFGIFIILIILFSLNYQSKDTQNSNLEYHNVTRVIDGDTFVIDTGDKVRLICMNTPEVNQEGYEEATQFLRRLVEGKEVTLEKDTSDTDKYRRLLRYVYVENKNKDFIFVNKEIVSNGYAVMLRIPPNTKRCDEIERLE